MPRAKVYARRGSDHHRHDRMSATTFRVVEVDDPWGDFAHCYVRMTSKQCILIDTGCGIGNIQEYINKHINREKKPFLVICTHSHFDHIGSNHLFSDPSMQVCFGANDKEMTLASRGGKMINFKGELLDHTRHFNVTRWLQDGELIPLDDAAEEQPDPAHSLQVIYTPGHMSDSITLYDPEERRCFTGDFLYPAADWSTYMDEYPQYPPGGLFIIPPGASLDAYLHSLLKFKAYVSSKLDASLPEPTLACGHNSYCTDITFVDSTLELLQQVKADAVPPDSHIMAGMHVWEFKHARDRRATVVVPANWVNVDYGEVS